MPLISVQNISFSYASSKSPVLDIKQFSVEKSEKTILFGPSGSGKTTLLSLLAGIIVPSRGRIEILGQNLPEMKARRRDQFRGRHIGYIFQLFNLVPYLTIEENIMLPAKAKGKASGSLQHMHHLSEQLGISSILAAKAMEVSVGQAQRAACARALLLKPEIILADEPTSSLDADNRQNFLNTLFSICEENGTTLVFVSHDSSFKKLFDKQVSLAEL